MKCNKNGDKPCLQHGDNGCPDELTTDDIMEKDCQIIREQMTKFLMKYYGEACPDFEKDCPNCTVWRALEVICDDYKEL